MNITEVVSKINNNIKDNKLTYKIDESIKSYLYYIFKTIDLIVILNAVIIIKLLKVMKIVQA